MALSEAARVDLYTGLAQLLGPDRAETLMAALPFQGQAELATKADLGLLAAQIDVLGTRIDGLDSRIDGLETRIDRLESRMERVEARLDRLFLTLVAGLLVIVGSNFGLYLTS